MFVFNLSILNCKRFKWKRLGLKSWLTTVGALLGLSPPTQPHSATYRLHWTTLNHTQLHTTTLIYTQLYSTRIGCTHPATLNLTQLQPTTLNLTQLQPTTLNHTRLHSKPLNSTQLYSTLPISTLWSGKSLIVLASYKNPLVWALWTLIGS